MAQGDAIIYSAVLWGSSGSNVELQPSSGVEWCITSWMGGSHIELQHKRSSSDWTDSGNSTSYRSMAVVPGTTSQTYNIRSLGNYKQWYNNTYYPRLYIYGSTNQVYTVSGIQSK